MSLTKSTNAPLHVVHIISGLLHGGAETVLHRLASTPTEGIRHTVISMRSEGIFGPRLRAAGVEVTTLDMQGPFASMRGLLRLYGLLRRLQPDVVQTWMYHADLIGGLVARLAGIRAIAWGIRNSGIDLAQSSRSSRVTAWFCARVSGWVPGVIVACAQKAADVHVGWGYRADRMLVAPNGYDLAVWQPDADDRARLRAEWGIEAGAPLLGSMARWNPLKDHANLFAALALSVRAHPGLRCVLAGLGMSRDNAPMMAMARHYGLLDHLIFLGRRDDVPVLMRALDVHVLSSRAEGFPNVVCEAMASGVVCVATDVGDAALIVGTHGWIVPPHDPVALSGAIGQAIQALGEPQLAERLQQARDSVAARYSLQAMTERYAVIWRRLAQDYPNRSRHAPASVAGAGSTGPQAMHTADAFQATGRPAARRILFFLNNPAFLMSHRLPLALAARDAGFEVHVATPDGPTVADIVAHGLHHHVVPLSRSGTNPWVEARSLLAFLRLLRHLRPDLVHTITIKAVLYGGIASRIAGVPAFVAAISGLGYVFMRPGRFDPLRQAALWLYRLALGHRNSRVIFQNANDRDVLLQARAIRAGQAVMIRGSGVDLQQFSPQPFGPPPITVVMASRLLRDKGVMEYIEAAGLSASRGAGLRWVLAGSVDPGNPASITQTELDGWVRTRTIEYVGECQDVAALYASAHVVVLPSYREGLPKSLVEAAACGRPVVTTDVPGCRDAIIPGESGVLVPARDAQALAEAVMALAVDEATRQRMGLQGRRLAEHDFGIQSIVQSHLGMYRTLLGASEG